MTGPDSSRPAAKESTAEESTAMQSTAAAIRAGDEAAFGALAERYRHELRVHCYRMLGSFADTEDLVQETLLRAWHRRDTFGGRATFRAWLYRIATNACLNFLASPSHTRQVQTADALELSVARPRRWSGPSGVIGC